MKGLQHTEDSLSNVIQGCKEWLYKNWMVSLKNVYREGNHVANHLAKMALKHHQNNFIYYKEFLQVCLGFPPPPVKKKSVR